MATLSGGLDVGVGAVRLEFAALAAGDASQGESPHDRAVGLLYLPLRRVLDQAQARVPLLGLVSAGE